MSSSLADSIARDILAARPPLPEAPTCFACGRPFCSKKCGERHRVGNTKNRTEGPQKPLQHSVPGEGAAGAWHVVAGPAPYCAGCGVVCLPLPHRGLDGLLRCDACHGLSLEPARGQSTCSASRRARSVMKPRPSAANL